MGLQLASGIVVCVWGGGGGGCCCVTIEIISSPREGGRESKLWGRRPEGRITILVPSGSVVNTDHKSAVHVRKARMTDMARRD